MKKFLKITYRFFLSLFNLILFAIFLGIILLQSPQIENSLLDYIFTKFKNETGWHVSLTATEGFLPFNLKAKNISIHRPDQQHLLAESGELSISFWDFLKGEFKIEYFHLDGVELTVSKSVIDQISSNSDHQLLDSSQIDSTITTSSSIPSYISYVLFHFIDFLLSQNFKIDYFNISNCNITIHDMTTLEVEILQGHIEYTHGNNNLDSKITFGSLIYPQQQTTLYFSGSPQTQSIILKNPVESFLSKIWKEIPPQLEFTLQIENQILNKTQNHPLNSKGFFQIDGSYASSFFPNSFTVTSNYDLNDLKSLKISDFQAKIFTPLHSEDTFNFKGQFSLEDFKEIEGFIKTHQHDVSYFSLNPHCPVHGELDIEIQFYGQLSNPNLSIKALSPSLHVDPNSNLQLILNENNPTALDPFIFHNFSLEAQIQKTHHVVYSRWKLNSKMKELPIQLGLAASWDLKHLFHLTDIKGHVAGSDFSGNLSYNSNKNLILGNLKAFGNNFEILKLTPELFIKNIDGLDNSIELAPKGSYELNLSLAEDQGKQEANILFHIINGEFYHYAFQQLELNSQWKDLFSKKIAPIGIIQAHIQGLKDIKSSFSSNEPTKNVFQAVSDYSFSTTLDFNQEEFPFNLEAKSNNSEELSFNAKGIWKYPFSTFSNNIDLLEDEHNVLYLTIHRFHGTLFSKPIVIDKPFQVTIEDDLIDLHPVSLTYDYIPFVFEGTHHPSYINYTLHGESIPLKWIAPLISQNADFIEGKASITVSFYGPPNEPQGDISLILNDTKFTDHPIAKTLLPLQGDFKAHFEHNFLDINGEITGINHEPIRLKSRLPCFFSMDPWTFKIDHLHTFSVHIETEVEIADVMELVDDEEKSLTGLAHIALDVGYINDKPHVQGHMSIHNGSYENLDTGAVIKDVRAHFIGDGHKLLLTELKGVDTGSGKISGNGFIYLEPEKNFPFELNLKIHQAELLHLDYAHATGSGNLRLHGDANKGTIEGVLDINQARITLPDEPHSHSNPIDIIYVNQPPYQPLPTIFKKSPTKWPVYFNLKLNVQNQAFVDGKNLNSQWGGHLSITGTTKAPLVNGEAKLIKGEFQFNGKPFVSQYGSINFAGDPVHKSTLYIVADQEVSNIKISAILKGHLYDPELAFRSNPPLSQKDIISWLLFNKGSSDVTSFEGEQLKNTMITLSSGNDSPGVLGKLRQSIGIDRLDISNTTDGDLNEVSLHVGKYISSGVFVSLKKSINADANQVAIEANLTPRIKIQAEVGDDAEGKMFLKYEKDY